jgi:hypothetical protein
MENTSRQLNPPPKFQFRNKKVVVGEVGGTFFLDADGDPICEYQSWAFSSCGLATLYGFKNFHRYEFLNDHHEELFQWLEHNIPPNGGRWKCQEYLMALSTKQQGLLLPMLKHPCVREVDHFLNKAHGPNYIHLYRMSLQKDFYDRQDVSLETTASKLMAPQGHAAVRGN